MYILWTIESVRKYETGFAPTVDRFPSLNPLVGLLGRNEILNQSEYHQQIVDAYQQWWADDLTLQEKLSTDPLGGTMLFWR